MEKTSTAAHDSATASTPNGESHLLFPMTSLKVAATSEPVVVTGANGLRITTADGREFVDAFAGLLNVNVGYGRQELGEVAAAAMTRLSYTTNFFHRTSREAIALSAKLAELTPAGIENFIFTLGGSDAMDTAVKLVRHANVLAGKPEKMVIVSRRDSYHGMTYGGTSATGQSHLRDSIGPLVPGFVHIDQPDPALGGPASAEKLEAAIVAEGPGNVAAFVAEPLSMPPGVCIPPDGYWSQIQEICRRHDVRLILDEVVTGFGRTGKMFGAETWGIDPDVMTMSKGITSGYFPLGAVGVRSDLYDELANGDGILPHGFTAGGTPAACAVALANIEIMERERLVENSAAMGEHLAQRLGELEERHAGVVGVRSIGLVGGFDVDERIPGGADGVVERLQQDGVIVRAYGGGRTVGMGTALTVTREELDSIFEAIERALQGDGQGA